ncbi:MAG: ABC transporter ATP-binding protein [Chloroflexi bacterium]|nr:ABC transporter ATP-binding protein [Chloroflexota bacterium]
MPTPLLDIRDLTVVYAGERNAPDLPVLDGLTFTVAEREFVAILGPSGCGKSTLLRVLAGLLPPTQGQVRFAGRPVRGPLREVGMVFQSANLLPWRTVLGNILLPLQLQGVPEAQARAQALDMVRLLGLEGFEDTLPRDLSGGMAQRVALGRALVHRPRLLLLDEPFANLDALTRESMWGELLRLWRARGQTVVMVTHSITEALLLADRVLVLGPRPARLRLDLTVPLPRPRHADMRFTPSFGSLVAQVRAALGWPQGERSAAGREAAASTAPA